MNGSNPRSTARIARHPIHPMLVGFPIAFFFATLVTDLAFAKTGDPLWVTASVWLLLAGLVMAGLAAIAGIIDFLGDRRIRSTPIAWAHGLGNATALVIAIFNFVIHNRDGYSTVVPIGPILSAIVVVILLFTAWLGGELVFRQRAGVADS